jgi:hypothetical protein
MRDWKFGVTREVNTHPVADFRWYLKDIGLLRKYKGRLLATKPAKAGLAEPAELWRHIAETLIPTASTFAETAGVVVLVHAATTRDQHLDMPVIARTMSELGWLRSGGGSVSVGDVYPVWNDLWAAVGNVGTPQPRATRHERALSEDAVALIRDALFTEVPVTDSVD